MPQTQFTEWELWKAINLSIAVVAADIRDVMAEQPLRQVFCNRIAALPYAPTMRPWTGERF